MADTIVQATPTSTAAGSRTEPVVVAAISSAKGQSTAGVPERRSLTTSSWLLLWVAGLAIAALTGWWMRRD